MLAGSPGFRQTAFRRILSGMREKWTIVGSLSTAVAASLCCTLPLALGVGVAGLGAVLQPWRPLLSGIVVVLLARGFYNAYKPLPACDCAPESRRGARIGIWMSSVVALSLLVIPYASGAATVPAQGTPVVFHVQGMTCSGCERPVEQAIRSVDGVNSVEASSERSRAVVTFDPQRVNPEAVIAAVENAGYQARRE
jgi:mercuric ion transport protein